MEYTKTVNIPGLFVFVDFEKAFDSIEWNFMSEALKAFNFGPGIIDWFETFYMNISSCMVNNGWA